MSAEREGLRDLFHRARSDEALGSPWTTDDFIDRILTLLREGGEPVATLRQCTRCFKISEEVWGVRFLCDDCALKPEPYEVGWLCLNEHCGSANLNNTKKCWNCDAYHGSAPHERPIYTHPAPEPEPEPSGDWWCPTCRTMVSPEEVTFEEYHETCGGAVAPEPSNVEAMRQALEDIEQLTQSGFMWNATIGRIARRALKQSEDTDETE